MTFDEIIARLKEAKGDPEQLALATVDVTLAGQDKRLREALEAAAIPHWFDERILAHLLDADPAESAVLRERLVALPMVESFAARKGWNVHEATRLALRRKLQSSRPDRFLELSAKASAYWEEAGDDVVFQIEALYHSLISQPEAGADRLERTYWKWDFAGRFEATQALGTALDELTGVPLADSARGRVLFVLGWIRLARIPLKQSEQSTREAVTLLEATGSEASYADARSLLGRILEREGRPKEALAEYQSCKRIMESLTERDPANTDWQRNLFGSHTFVGRVYQAQGTLEEALGEYHSSKRIMESLTVESDPANLDWQKDLSTAHSDVGNVYDAQGKLNEALAEYQSSKRIMESLTARDRANTDWQWDLSVSHQCVGHVNQAQGKLEEALVEYRSRKRIMESLTALDAANTDWQHDLSVSHNNLGSVYQAQGKLEEALGEYQSGKRIMESLTVLDPTNTNWQSDLSVSHNRLGSVYQALGAAGEARAEFEAGLAIVDRLVVHDPTNAGWQEDLEYIRNLIANLPKTKGAAG